MVDDYVVRFGGAVAVERSCYMNRKEAIKLYNSIKLDTKITWKELLYEPLDEADRQDIIASEEVKVLDLGICKIAVPAV